MNNDTAGSEPVLLTGSEAGNLLDIARLAVTEATKGNLNWRPELQALPTRLRRPGASFVTLHTHGRLHGCIGSVEARHALALDVARNAQSAALHDPRFPPLLDAEVDETDIEVSVLSALQALPFADFADLCRRVRPGIDGVLVERGWQRGLLLPQVWEQIPGRHEFLNCVAMKAGATAAIFDHPDAHVFVFQVHHYEQPAPAHRAS